MRYVLEMTVWLHIDVGTVNFVMNRLYKILIFTIYIIYKILNMCAGIA